MDAAQDGDGVFFYPMCMYGACKGAKCDLNRYFTSYVGFGANSVADWERRSAYRNSNALRAER